VVQVVVVTETASMRLLVLPIKALLAVMNIPQILMLVAAAVVQAQLALMPLAQTMALQAVQVLQLQLLVHH
jgi:hypothetical protein